MLSLDLTDNYKVDFSSNKKDIKYDYDNYDQRYKESDFKVVNVEFRDFKEIEHFFRDKPEE